MSRHAACVVTLPSAAPSARQAVPRGTAGRLDRPVASGGTPLTLSTPVLRLTDERWQRIAALLPPPQERGRRMEDARPLLAGILWIMQTGAPWRRLPAEFGHWHTAYTRYQDWQRSGLWTTILAILAGRDADDPL